MSAPPLRVETTGETVGEAKWAALRELERLHPGVDRSAVHFQVVSEGERGLLGVGYSPARVVAAVDAAEAQPAPAAPEESEAANRLREFLEAMITAFGIRAQIRIDEDDESLIASCSGPELGLLIGRHGQTIDALQYLANAILFRGRDAERKAIVVDAAGYRARRQAALDTLALRSAERALATQSPVELEPMTAVERKLVHLRLKDYAGVQTRSEGTEPNRFVVVAPASSAGA